MVCPKCNYHFRIGSEQYISIIFDKGSFKELDKNEIGRSARIYGHEKYSERIVATIKRVD